MGNVQITTNIWRNYSLNYVLQTIYFLLNFWRKGLYSSLWTSPYYPYSNKDIMSYKIILWCSQCTKIDIEQATRVGKRERERERLNDENVDWCLRWKKHKSRLWSLSHPLPGPVAPASLFHFTPAGLLFAYCCFCTKTEQSFTNVSNWKKKTNREHNEKFFLEIFK